MHQGYKIYFVMVRTVLSDTKWENIKDYLSGKAGDCGVTAKDNRRFVEAVLWIARTGSPWRDLPDEFGHWHRVYMRYSRWGKKGTWVQLLTSVSDVPDLEYLMVDGSIVRVHQHGAAKKTAKTKRQWAMGNGQWASRGAGPSPRYTPP
jgi:transposase